MRIKRKKFTAVLLCLFFSCIMQIHTVSAAAEPVLSAYADTAAAVQGNSVNIQIRLNSNPGFSTLGMTLNYDNSLLQYQDSVWSNQFFGEDMTMASDTGNMVNLSVVCEDACSTDGTIVTVCFEAIQDFSSVPASLSLRDMTDTNLASVSGCQIIQEIQVPLEVQETEHEPETAEVADSGAETEDVPEIENQAEIPEKDVTIQPAVQAAQTDTDLKREVSGNHTESIKADSNYKTGKGIGNDSFLLAAVVCGIICLLLFAGKAGREEKA